MVSPRRLAAALRALSAPPLLWPSPTVPVCASCGLSEPDTGTFLSMLVTVMSLPPVMKKARPPPCGRRSRSMSCPGSRDRLPGCWCCGQWPVVRTPYRKAVCGPSPRIKSGAGSVVNRAWVLLGSEVSDVVANPASKERSGTPVQARTAQAPARAWRGAKGSAPSSKEIAMEAWARTLTHRPAIRGEVKPSQGAGGPASCAPRRACPAASASPGLPPPPASRHSRE